MEDNGCDECREEGIDERGAADGGWAALAGLLVVALTMLASGWFVWRVLKYACQ